MIVVPGRISADAGWQVSLCGKTRVESKEGILSTMSFKDVYWV